ncbi:hypothetical protein [Streptomyces sp. Ac-502]|uniref:hypothetical protein n=1 Tax=Streptomyces sp. Ac-502 TaxID=3342801 RepID=UPI00386256EB
MKEGALRLKRLLFPSIADTAVLSVDYVYDGGTWKYTPVTARLDHADVRTELGETQAPEPEHVAGGGPFVEGGPPR